MAHDRQVKQESEESSSRGATRSSLDAVADWLTLSVQVWREEPTAELALLYRETLKDIPVRLLERAFLRVAKSSKFRPTPAEILEAAGIEAEIARGGNRPHYLDEPKISQEEREAALNDPEYQALRRKLFIVAKEKSA